MKVKVSPPYKIVNVESFVIYLWGIELNCFLNSGIVLFTVIIYPIVRFTMIVNDRNIG